MDLVVDCYELTRMFPKDEMYGLTSQIRRAAVSVPANIAEGYGRDASGSYVQFLKVAQGSLKELETLIDVSVRVGIVSVDRVEACLARADDTGRMLRGLIRSIQKQAEA